MKASLVASLSVTLFYRSCQQYLFSLRAISRAVNLTKQRVAFTVLMSSRSPKLHPSPVMLPHPPPVRVLFAPSSPPADAEHDQGHQQDHDKRRHNGDDGRQTRNGRNLAAQRLGAQLPSFRPVWTNVLVVGGCQQRNRIRIRDAGGRLYHGRHGTPAAFVLRQAHFTVLVVPASEEVLFRCLSGRCEVVLQMPYFLGAEFIHLGAGGFRLLNMV
ncbi:hypothetical protein BDP81DRAFT_23332 [Colletotrichum phormii]|uniref:Uncharacterized protein n=1 Tax=Colletotrichum phormii TaxID=359342 RepID=A0AAI9ZT19_9PEZI|nr:uncharacterized protein BDP81DRAFT_23332 [Colletotrichum phormii]KAK1636483.1 hypothetical protein BDP81DRAFT_23332 [Colletotrichum phormii]